MHCSRSHCPAAAPMGDHLAEGVDQRGFFQAVPLAAADDAAGAAAAVDRLPAVAAFLGDQRQRGPAAFVAQQVGQLVGGDGKQIALQRLIRIVVRQAVEETDEGLLDQVLGRGPIGHPAGDEAQQPAFVARAMISFQASGSPARMRAINKDLGTAGGRAHAISLTSAGGGNGSAATAGWDKIPPLVPSGSTNHYAANLVAYATRSSPPTLLQRAQALSHADCKYAGRNRIEAEQRVTSSVGWTRLGSLRDAMPPFHRKAAPRPRAEARPHQNPPPAAAPITSRWASAEPLLHVAAGRPRLQ